MAGSIAERWEEISGKDNWNNLLDPLDIDLRRSILNYGNLNEAVGDAFNEVKLSKNYGTSRYSKANLFDRVGLVKGNPFKYEVTKFFYATSQIDLPEILFVRNSSWIGYVAVATDEGKVALGRRDIVIAWRGTRLNSEWIDDIAVIMVSASEILGNASTGGGAKDPKVHEGFLSIYTSTDPESSYSKTSAREQAWILSASALSLCSFKWVFSNSSVLLNGYSLTLLFSISTQKACRQANYAHATTSSAHPHIPAAMITGYSSICRMVQKLVNILKQIDPRDPYRIEMTDSLLEKFNPCMLESSNEQPRYTFEGMVTGQVGPSRLRSDSISCCFEELKLGKH